MYITMFLYDSLYLYLLAYGVYYINVSAAKDELILQRYMCLHIIISFLWQVIIYSMAHNLTVLLFIFLTYIVDFCYNKNNRSNAWVWDLRIFSNYPGSDANTEAVADLVKFIFNDCKPYKIRIANIYSVFPTP